MARVFSMKDRKRMGLSKANWTNHSIPLSRDQESSCHKMIQEENGPLPQSVLSYFVLLLVFIMETQNSISVLHQSQQQRTHAGGGPRQAMADCFGESGLTWEKSIPYWLQQMVIQANWADNGNCKYHLWRKYIIPNLKPILPILQNWRARISKVQQLILGHRAGQWWSLDLNKVSV